MTTADEDVIHDIHDPAQVERKIQEVKNRIAKGVVIVSQQEKTAKAARRGFDNAFAHAFLAAEGAEQARRQTAIAGTIGDREAAEEAEIAFRHAERQMDALSKELYAWQSILNSVRSMLAAVGSR